MRSNRERSLDAAIDVLASHGMRALTHRRVDQRAGLPPGSTSNHFRTRAALLHGVVQRMVQQEAPTVTAAIASDSPEEFLDAMCQLLDFLTGPNRATTAARFALFVEAAHDATLRPPLSAGRADMQALVQPALARLGAQEPEAATNALISCLEGLILQRLGRHVEVDARAVLTVVVRGSL